MLGMRIMGFSGDLEANWSTFLSYRHINLANATFDELEQLAQSCLPASFGVNDKEVLDETYRKAGTMDLERFGLQLHLEQTDLMEIIRSYLLEGVQSTKSIGVELHKLNVYGTFNYILPTPPHHPDTKLLPRQGVFL
jgi:hypothetical protein